MAPLFALASGAASGLPAHVPVLLIPGWSDTGRDLTTLRRRLVAAGWSEGEVVAVTFRDPFGDNTTHAGEIAEAVDALLADTGADRLDIVAHSMGGLATRKYLDDPGGAARVRRVVLLATPNQGTWAAYLAFGGGRSDMMPGSPFVDSLNVRPSIPEGVDALTVRTRTDLHILPSSSATLPGVKGVEVCCPTHEGLLDDDRVFDIVRDFLGEGIVNGAMR